MQMTAEGIPLLLKIVEDFPQDDFPARSSRAAGDQRRTSLRDGPELVGSGAHKNIYLKLTSRTVEHCQAGKATPETFMPKLVADIRFASRILWGSNFPAHDDTLPNIVKETLHVLDVLRPPDQANILSGTAERLYPSLK